MSTTTFSTNQFAKYTQAQLLRVEQQLKTLKKERSVTYIKPQQKQHILPLKEKYIKPLEEKYIKPVNIALKELKKYKKPEKYFFELNGIRLNEIPQTKKEFMQSLDVLPSNLTTTAINNNNNSNHQPSEISDFSSSASTTTTSSLSSSLLL